MEDDIMKTTFSKTALGAVVAILVGGVAGPALSSPFAAVQQESVVLLAEDGAEMLQQYHQLRQERLQAQRSEQEGERFTQMLEEQPTAAGEQREPEERLNKKDDQSSKGWAPQYKSNMHQQRMEYGH
jgi:hypothetical protein